MFIIVKKFGVRIEINLTWFSGKIRSSNFLGLLFYSFVCSYVIRVFPTFFLFQLRDKSVL